MGGGGGGGGGGDINCRQQQYGFKYLNVVKCHRSSTLHIYASSATALRFDSLENQDFSNPFERFTPSQR